jgi:transcriptional regulator with XRE-family HTH domain
MSTTDRLRIVIGDMTIEAFAELIDEKPQRIKDVLRGKQKIPADLLLKLAEQLYVDLNWLVADVGDRAPGELSSRESALLDNYRKADDEGRAVIEKTANFAAQPKAEYRGVKPKKNG